MSIDPDELKVEKIKKKQQIYEIEKYIEEQNALDKKSATGKMGHREIKQETAIKAKISSILKKALDFFSL